MTGSIKLQELIRHTSVLGLTGHTGFLVSTGRTILEFAGLLELKVHTALLEFTEGIGLQTSTERTDLTWIKRMQRFIRINSTNIDRKHKVTRIKGCTSVLELTGR